MFGMLGPLAGVATWATWVEEVMRHNNWRTFTGHVGHWTQITNGEKPMMRCFVFQTAHPIELERPDLKRACGCLTSVTLAELLTRMRETMSVASTASLTCLNASRYQQRSSFLQPVVLAANPLSTAREPHAMWQGKQSVQARPNT